MLVLNSILLAVAVFVQFSDATDYCKIDRAHTMCQFTGVSPKCKAQGIDKGGLTKAEQDAIVQKHNELRQKVASGQETRGKNGPQPSAKNMPNLVWDNELAEVAQRWADQCDFQHDKVKQIDRFDLGQNIATQGFSNGFDDVDIVQMVQDWYDEVKEFDKNSIKPFKWQSYPQIGHYTQMVWAKTTHVGCGLRNYFEGGYYRALLVCNYGPRGNMLETTMYEVGTPSQGAGPAPASSGHGSPSNGHQQQQRPQSGQQSQGYPGSRPQAGQYRPQAGQQSQGYPGSRPQAGQYRPQAGQQSQGYPNSQAQRPGGHREYYEQQAQQVQQAYRPQSVRPASGQNGAVAYIYKKDEYGKLRLFPEDKVPQGLQQIGTHNGTPIFKDHSLDGYTIQYYSQQSSYSSG